MRRDRPQAYCFFMRAAYPFLVVRTLWAVGLLVLAGCGRDAPTSPTSSNRVLSGAVVLVGYLTDSNARFTGTKVFADADGVPVELVAGSRAVATTTTVQGRYTFANVPNGSYFVRTRITPELLDQTALLTVAGADVVVLDTLRLTSRGDLFSYPNPFQISLAMTFNVLVSEPSSLRVLDRAGRTVRTLLEGNFPQGMNGWSWNGTDSNGSPVPAGYYWLTFQTSFGERAQLVFRQ